MTENVIGSGFNNDGNARVRAKIARMFFSFLKMHLSRGWVMGTMGGGLILRTGLICMYGLTYPFV